MGSKKRGGFGALLVGRGIERVKMLAEQQKETGGMWRCCDISLCRCQLGEVEGDGSKLMTSWS